jgi:hypothetical protein
VKLKVNKSIRLEQLSEEIRGLPGLSRLSGISACGPLEDGETLLTLHVEGPSLTVDEQRAVAQALEDHLPDEQWGLSADQKAIRSLLQRPAGSLTLPDVEELLRLLLRVLDVTSEADFPVPYGGDN